MNTETKRDVVKEAQRKLEIAIELHKEIGSAHYLGHDVLVVAMSAVMTLKGIEKVNPGTMDTAFELVEIYEQYLAGKAMPEA